jgi:hypothetical protein
LLIRRRLLQNTFGFPGASRKERTCVNWLAVAFLKPLRAILAERRNRQGGASLTRWIPVCGLALASLLPQTGNAQAFTWHQVRDRFEADNPALHAADLGIDEARAQEITAFLRPNPTATATLDQFNPFWPNPYRPLGALFPLVSTSYLHEREDKRDLRLESAKKGTQITAFQRADLERTLVFNLRGAFVQTLQAKAILDLARDNLAYYDRLLGVSRTASAPAIYRRSTCSAWIYSERSTNPMWSLRKSIPARRRSSCCNC